MKFDELPLIVYAKNVSMVARLCSSVLLIIALSSAFARPSEGDKRKHFLWRLQSASQPFYLLGSIHALRADDYPLGSEIDNAIGQCRRFVFEYDSYHTDPRLWLNKVRAAEHYPAGTTLKQRVRPETYAFLQRIARVRASEYDDTKPWAIACFMVRHPFYHDVHAYYGVESYVRRRAGWTAQFGGLESLDEHLAVLSGMSDPENEVFLLQTFAADGNARAMSRLIAAFKRGDTAGVAAVDATSDREAPYLHRRFITDRNAKWVPRIETEIRSGKPTMIVVGARHLCGPNNLVSLLQDRGYDFEQL